MFQITNYHSPNYDQRDRDVPLQFLVLHYTGMRTGGDAIIRMCNEKAKVSAHYVIEENGSIAKLVNEDMRAWHAGKSHWRGVTDINSASIGIELVNPGHQYGYRPFPAKQVSSLKKLAYDIMKRNKLAAHGVLAHSDVAPDRKEDPGELFPWAELADEGIGIWPRVRTKDYGFADDAEVQQLLAAIGYECPQSGGYDRPTRAALLAFQRHFHPENLTGTPEKETVARLRALAREVAGNEPKQ